MVVDIAVISPTDHLEYSEYGDIQMCLAPLLVGEERSDEYREHSSARDAYTIVDNGAFELQEDGVGLGFDRVIEALQVCDGDEIVITDHLYDGERTVAAVDECLRELEVAGIEDEVTVHAVPQGSTVEEWFDCFDALLVDERIDVLGLSKLSVPESLGYDERPGYLFESRIEILEEIVSRYEHTDKGVWKASHEEAAKKIHLLGGGPWLARELAAVAPRFGFVRSVDSSMPVRYGFDSLRISSDSLDIDHILQRKNLKNWGAVSDGVSNDIMHNIATLHRSSKTGGAML